MEAGQLDESSLVQSASGELSAQDKELLKAYHHSFDDEKVDLDLIMHLLFNICQSSDEGEGKDRMKNCLRWDMKTCSPKSNYPNCRFVGLREAKAALCGYVINRVLSSNAR